MFVEESGYQTQCQHIEATEDSEIGGWYSRKGIYSAQKEEEI